MCLGLGVQLYGVGWAVVSLSLGVWCGKMIGVMGWVVLCQVGRHKQVSLLSEIRGKI